MSWDRLVDKHIVHEHFSLCKKDFYRLFFVQESSIPKHGVRSYCLFTNVLFKFELMFLSNRLTVFCHPKPPP